MIAARGRTDKAASLRISAATLKDLDASGETFFKNHFQTQTAERTVVVAELLTIFDPDSRPMLLMIDEGETIELQLKGYADDKITLKKELNDGVLKLTATRDAVSTTVVQGVTLPLNFANGDYPVVFLGTIDVPPPPPGGMGDPYITTLGGVTYKMDDFTGYSRMLQGTLHDKLFTINAETKLLTREEITDLRLMRIKQNESSKNTTYDAFPSYFTRLYVAWGEDNMTIDLGKLLVTDSTIPTENAVEKCVENEYTWSSKKSDAEKMLIPFGDVTLVVKKFENKDIRNGFSVLGGHHIKNKSGALEHTIYTKDMRLKKLTTLKPLRRLSNRPPKRMSNEVFFENDGVGKNIKLPIF
jgi:hypothetical protein